VGGSRHLEVDSAHSHSVLRETLLEFDHPFVHRHACQHIDVGCQVLLVVFPSFDFVADFLSFGILFVHNNLVFGADGVLEVHRYLRDCDHTVERRLLQNRVLFWEA